MADSRDDFIIAIRYALLKKGTKQKFSLFFLISLSILTIGLDKLSLPFVLSTRALLNDFVYKVAVITAAPGKFIILLNNEKIEHFNIVAKNKILKKEIKKLKKERYDALYLKAENESLKQVLELGSARSGYEETTIKARVVLDQKSPYLKSLLINKGTKRNISKGMTVFSQSYLIGTVIETNYLSSRVLLITDLNSKIPVVIQDTSVNAILTGMGKKTQLNLEYLPDDFILEPNKIIYTSGKDGFFAAGLPIAKTYLNKKNKLIIKSLANPQQALVVHVTNGQFNK
jgi:rod shape-determining protein MreC|tara:strand:+ start:119 stop:976 length:858 start_codon:yes stop_codon:yes gene_type:complete